MNSNKTKPSINWTEEQEAAINTTGGKILVSAAAGSGKTMVLTQRVIRRISDPQAKGDINRFLMVTFTRAAAAQMRERISKALFDLAKEQPKNKHIRQQRMKIPQANISTIHSFCLKLLENTPQIQTCPQK